MCSQYTIFSLPNCIQSVLTGTCERCCCAISAGEDCLSIVCFIKCALRPRGMFRAAEKGASLAAAWLLREGASGLPRAPSRDGRMGRLPPPCGEGEAVGGGGSAPAPRGTQPGLSLLSCLGHVDACPFPTVRGWQHWPRPVAGGGLGGHQGGGQRVGGCCRSPWPLCPAPLLLPPPQH